MINLQHFQDLLKKEMSRKQFLQAVGAGLLSIVGFTAFIKNIDKFARTQTKPQTLSKGYGKSTYGG